MHRGSAGEIETAHAVYPARGVPGPAGDGVIDDGGPDEHVDDAGEHPTAFGDCTNSKCNSVYILVQASEVRELSSRT